VDDAERILTRLQNYREYILFRCPTVRFLDYRKVKLSERERARELFGTVSEPSALASKIMGIKSKTFDVPSANGVPGQKGMRVKLTEKERKRVEEMIRNAKSLQEIVRLERELNEGRVPVGARDEDVEMEG
jgi:U2 small nuclear ribonucleoprotein A'